MRFSINKTELQSALAVVQKGISVRSTLPVLSGILVSVRDGRMTLQSTDLELSIQCSAPALVEEEGRTVVPGKLFSDIVKSLPDAAIRFQAADGASDAQVACDSSVFSIRTLSAEDFPGFPSVSPDEELSLPFETFSQLVKRVAKVVSKDESRAILTGILIEREGDVLRMVATDSYRLAMTEAQVQGQGTDDGARNGGSSHPDPSSSHSPHDIASDSFSVVIGGAFLNDVAGLPAAGEMVTIGVAENQIIVRCGNTTFINRRIEGQYPNYRQLLPNDHATRAKFTVTSLTSAVKRASLMSSSSAPIRISLAPDPVNLAVVTVNSADLGSVRENIDCPIEGEEMEIAFNSAYVSDGLAVMKDQEMYFDVQSPLKPGIFRTIDSNDFLYLIMPVRI